jgi:hypothetical protein
MQHIRSFKTHYFTMLYRVLPAFILLLLSFFGQAQKKNNVWAFGINGGLNFNTNPVSPFKSKASADEAIYYISSICDKDGNLLIYTDGRKVWNHNNLVMPKHNNWWFLSGEKLMPLICPYPDNDWRWHQPLSASVHYHHDETSRRRGGGSLSNAFGSDSISYEIAG